MAEDLNTALVDLDELYPEFSKPEAIPEAPPAPAEDDSPSIRLSPDQEARLLRQLKAHRGLALEGREESQSRREERYRRFLSDPSLRDGAQPWEDAPRLFLSMTRKAIEVLLDRFMAVLGQKEAVQVKGFGEEDVAKSKKKSQFFAWALENLNEWRVQLKMVLQDALIDSLGVVKTYPFKQPFDAPYPEAEVLNVFVQIEAVDIGTMLIPPDAEGLQWPQASFIGHQLYVGPDDFHGMRERGFDLPTEDEIEAMGRRNEKDLTDDERKYLEFTREGWYPDTADDEYDPQFEMCEMYERFDIDDDGRREFVVVHWLPNLRTHDGVEGLGHLARVLKLDDALPQRAFSRHMWPFHPIRCWRQGRQLRGLNVPDRLESAQDLLNRLAEQMVHQGTIDILPFVFANVAMTGDLPNLGRVKPGEIVPIDQIGGTVTFHTPSSSNRHYIEQMQVAKSWGEEDIPVTALTQGRNPDQPNTPRTLGGLSLMLQQNNSTFEEMIRELATQLTPALKMAFALWQHRGPASISIPLPNTEGIEGELFPADEELEMVEISREELSGLFDVRLKVNPNQSLDQQKKLTLAERLDALLINVWPAGRRELWKDVWESMGLQEFDRFYPEAVALTETQIKVLEAQLRIGMMEAQLQQMAMPQMPGGEGGGAPSPFAQGGGATAPQSEGIVPTGGGMEQGVM